MVVENEIVVPRLFLNASRILADLFQKQQRRLQKK
jgi:hypothetical protein